MEEIHKTRKGQRIVFVWGSTVSFWVTKSECRSVNEGCSNWSECTVSSMMRNKICYPDITRSSLEDRKNWIQQGTRICAISIRCEWNCSLPSISYSWESFSSAFSHLSSLLPSVTLLACSLDASPVVLYLTVLFKVLYYKMFSFFVFVFYVLFVWKVL